MGWTVFKRTSYVLRSFAVEFPTNWMDQRTTCYMFRFQDDDEDNDGVI